MDNFKKLKFTKLSCNVVSRIRKQAKSNYHKVVIIDEMNLSTSFHKYKNITVCVVDSMNSHEFIETITDFLNNLKQSTKGKRIVIIFCCGYFNYLARYTCAVEISTKCCCGACEFHMTNENTDLSVETVQTVKNLVNSIVPNASYIPVPLPPYNVKWHLQHQLILSHKSCCSHISDAKIARQLLDKKLTSEAQILLDRNVSSFNAAIQKFCSKESVPCISWKSTYLTDSDLSSRQDNIVQKLNSLLADVIHSLYEEEFRQELLSLKEGCCEDEIIVKNEQLSDEETEIQEVLEASTSNVNSTRENKMLSGKTSSAENNSVNNNNNLSNTTADSVDINESSVPVEIETELPCNELVEMNETLHSHSNTDEQASVHLKSTVIPPSDDESSSNSCIPPSIIEDVLHLSEITDSERQNQSTTQPHVTENTSDDAIIVEQQDNVVVLDDDASTSFVNEANINRSASVQIISEEQVIDAETPLVAPAPEQQPPPSLSESLEFIPVADMKKEKRTRKRHETTDSDVVEDSEVSVFKRVVEEGDVLQVIITDSVLSSISEVLEKNTQYVNVAHICGGDALIPEINNAVIEAFNDMSRLKMLKKKKMFVALALGTTDLLSFLPLSSHNKSKRGGLPRAEIVEVVFNRLERIKQSVLRFNPQAVVFMMKLFSLNTFSLHKTIEQLNVRIHEENRRDKTVRPATLYPLKECKIPDLKELCLNPDLCHTYLKKIFGVVEMINFSLNRDKNNDKKRKQNFEALKQAKRSKSSKEVVYLNSHKNIVCTPDIEVVDDKLTDDNIVVLESNNKSDAQNLSLSNETIVTSEASSAQLIDIVAKKLTSKQVNDSVIKRVLTYIKLLQEKSIDVLPEFSSLNIVDCVCIMIAFMRVFQSSSEESYENVLIDIAKNCSDQIANNIDCCFTDKFPSKVDVMRSIGQTLETLENNDIHPLLHSLVENSTVLLKNFLPPL